jgi:chemotaxis protein CheX
MTQFPVEAHQAEVAQIVIGVFDTMLALDVEQAEQGWFERPNSITSAIFFAGERKGGVLIETTEDQACHWTSRLMSLPVRETVADDVQDAMGEIANMIGGNLKPVLPRGVQLSMPTVVRGSDYSLTICGGNLVQRQCFRSEGKVFWVSLVVVVN